MKKILFYAVIISMFYSCASTNNWTMNVTEPAPVTLPNDIKKVGVVNRTQSTIHKTINDIEKLTSLELLTVDSTSALQALKGLANGLKQNTRFTNVRNFSPMIWQNYALDDFSQTLSKEKVNKFCRDNSVDAIFVLEYFDTNTSISTKIVPSNVKVGGQNIPETMATVATGINAGWKIYDSAGDIIYDTKKVHDRVVSTGRGINPLRALTAITGQKGKVENVAYKIGKNYAADLLPFTHRVQRIYYVRGSANFKIAKRRARAGNWDGAAELWEIETKNPKLKVRGRAYFNMAVINEINGNLDEAIDWAEKSYTDFANKKALRYLNILKDRRARNDELRRQEGN